MTSTRNICTPNAHLNIDLTAIFKNWQIFNNHMTYGKAAAVVKADAYGLGAPVIAQYLEEKGISDFFVAHLSEGIILREYGIKGRIYTFNSFDDHEDTLKAYMHYHIIPTLNSLGELKALYAFLKQHNRLFEATLHVDTGMNRFGFPGSEWQQLSPNSPYFSLIKIHYIMSHLACADDAHNPYNQKQKAAFHKASAIWKNIPLSFANSAGIFLGEDYQGQLSRPGIGLYGGNPFADGRKNPTMPVLELLAPIMQIRNLKAGECVGYGCSWKAHRETQIATLSIGYADGIHRAIRNQGYGWLKGYKLPFVGRVSMDSLILDITELPASLKNIGQKVEILGKNITIDHMASWADTIAYEILTSLGARYLRNYIREKNNELSPSP